MLTHLWEGSFRGEQNILWLEVTVNNALGVKMAQGNKDLKGQCTGQPKYNIPLHKKLQ